MLREELGVGTRGSRRKKTYRDKGLERESWDTCY
jgi:hypothetical protein